MLQTKKVFRVSHGSAVADFTGAMKEATSRCASHAVAVSVLLAALGGFTPTNAEEFEEFADANPLPTASVHFEQNATDGDVEVVFKVKAADEGLSDLLIISPNGRKVVDFKAPDSYTLGIRQFAFESPEPPEVDALKAAYPEGVYSFLGRTASGQKLAGRSSLSHHLPRPAELVKPTSETLEVSTADAELSWSRIEDVVSYILEIEQDDLNMKLTVRLPASTTSFTFSDGLLLPGEVYELAIGTVNGDGNTSFVETEFTVSD